VKRVEDDGNTLFQSLAILHENISCCFLLRYLISDAETVIFC
jgi:hypothetical protein